MAFAVRCPFNRIAVAWWPSHVMAHQYTLYYLVLIFKSQTNTEIDLISVCELYIFLIQMFAQLATMCLERSIITTNTLRAKYLKIRKKESTHLVTCLKSLRGGIIGSHYDLVWRACVEIQRRLEFDSHAVVNRPARFFNWTVLKR